MSKHEPARDEEHIRRRLEQLDAEERDLHGKDMTPLRFMAHSSHLRQDAIDNERAKLRAALGHERSPDAAQRRSHMPGWMLLAASVVVMMAVLAITSALMN
ncbi:hypothetical protein [Microbacterium imperiale]|uniref:DUF3040 domain-containing protein n=1 Tax=Microbacterium imperiale TaxID=33884 RepID=A0A9W6HEV6_9MICO|nr:hypothetical protein [Microbacterium imperiale]MBP2419462.1 hypothetical protein [Microbacterium imperiale]MDS0198668.1 hypothetical protein [Microbacterium imperiale]BFE39804.1 hypothetical protein GCM10017544_07600 [Microbacterium imperiale]GLJ79221.1 hypothetical protein GCM10017586_09030 [Microbacterium imperiale]